MAGIYTRGRSGAARSAELGTHNHEPVSDGNVVRTIPDCGYGFRPRRCAAPRNDEIRMIPDRKAFVRANTRLKPVPHVPEISLYIADESVPIWLKTEEELDAIGLPPPYWAFAWAGGQALARYVLDNPDTVAGKRVLDLAAGSGLVAIAAAKAGAAPVIAADIDAFTEAAVAFNAEANDVYIEIIVQDLLDRPAQSASRYDVILVGDLFYERDTAARALAFLDRHAALGTRVLVGDPACTYLPKARLARLA